MTETSSTFAARATQPIQRLIDRALPMAEDGKFTEIFATDLQAACF